jgi:transposase, IS5 family
VKVDAKTKLIENFAVTDASVHDSQVMDELLTDKDADQWLYADSAYGGEKLEAVYAKKKVISKVNEKGYRNKPLTAEQKATNREKSKTRARVEHIFGFVENSMNGSFVRCIGIVGAKAKIDMMNLTYNLFRCAQFKVMATLVG